MKKCKCECGCLPYSFKCLSDANERLRSICIENHPELVDMVHICDLQGEECPDTGVYSGVLGKCYDELCEAIKTAQGLSDETFCDPDADNQDMIYFLPEKWQRLLRFSAFKSYYVNSLLYHYYYMGYGGSHTTSVGEIQEGRGLGTGFNQTSRKHISKEKENCISDRYKMMAQKLRRIVESFMKSDSDLCGCHHVPKKEDCCNIQGKSDFCNSEAI